MEDMIKKLELENKPLYSIWENGSPFVEAKDLHGESINMFCETCRNNQTFNCVQVIFNGKNILDYGTGTNISRIVGEDFTGGILTLSYTCALCKIAKRDFILRVLEEGKVEKIGQYPPLGIDIPKEIISLKKPEVEIIYQRGKISENLGYGIGAFAYYRRIVELCIDDLIRSLGDIIPPGKKEEYGDVLKKFEKEKNAQNRIDLIKDTIVDTSIDGNPLSDLYQLSSIGIHGLDDEQCLEYAESLRTLLLYVIDEIARERNKKDGLKKAMDKVKKLISTSK